MKLPVKLAAPLLVAFAISACNAGGSPTMPGMNAAGGSPQSSYFKASGYHRVCTDTQPEHMNCYLMAPDRVTPGVISGWAPADFQTAYNLPSATKGKGQIVAIVDAYDNPNVAADLAVYRKQWGLGTAKFAKYNQKGQKKNYPEECPKGPQFGWCLEIDLDPQMVSAVCPKCTIWLFEANSNNTNDLYAAEAEAAKMGAHIISNSYGGGGGSPSSGDFDKAGVTYLASAGDGGYGLGDPADYDTVVSVGGTVLSKSGTKYSEVVWPDSGAGCSVVSKPSWQHDPKCSERTGNDVSAVAFGVAEYDTLSYSGWITVQGTSIGSPMLSAVYALAGNADKRQSGKAFWTLSKKNLKKDLHAITAGQVGGCPASLSGTYLCKAGTGEFGTYSGPTGWGTPNGIGAF